MKVVLRQLSGDDLDVEISENATLTQLKDAINNSVKPANDQMVRILFRGRDLLKSRDSMSCAELGVVDASVLHILLVNKQQPLVIGAEEYVLLRELLRQAQVIRTDLQTLHSTLINSTVQVRNPPPELSDRAEDDMLKENLITGKVQKMVVATMQHVLNARKEMIERDSNLAQAALQGNTRLLSDNVLVRRSRIMASLQSIEDKMTVMLGQYNRLNQTGSLFSRAGMMSQPPIQGAQSRQVPPAGGVAFQFEVQHVNATPEQAANPMPTNVSDPPPPQQDFSSTAQDMFSRIMNQAMQQVNMPNDQSQQIFGQLIGAGLQQLFPGGQPHNSETRPGQNPSQEHQAQDNSADEQQQYEDVD